MRTIETIQEEIEAKNFEIEDKETEINDFEIDPDEKEESYCDILDETDGLFGVSYSQLMREHDNVMYRTGLNDYVDSLEVSEENDYISLKQELEYLKEELTQLEEELEELETD